MKDLYTYLIFIEYNGSKFKGWQKQPRLRTIQGELEKALNILTGEKIVVKGAGRTDSGVHAISQIATFSIKKRYPKDKLLYSLNAILPEDIAIKKIFKVKEGLNARYIAKWKIYDYLIWNNPCKSVWNSLAWHIKQPLNIRSIKKALRFLKGKKDFKAFTAAGGEKDNYMVNLCDANINKKGDLITITFKANRFLYKMVRNLVGTLVYVGLGKISIERFKDIINSGDRRNAGPTAPAYGLFLKNVIIDSRFKLE